jgi:hypothetical protein
VCERQVCSGDSTKTQKAVVAVDGVEGKAPLTYVCTRDCTVESRGRTGTDGWARGAQSGVCGGGAACVCVCVCVCVCARARRWVRVACVRVCIHALTCLGVLSKYSE